MYDTLLLCLVTALLAVHYAISIGLSRLNSRSADQPLPAELVDMYPPETLTRTRLYIQVNAAFGQIEGAWSLGLLLIFWGLNGWRIVHEFAAGAHAGPVVTGTLFLLGCGFLSWLAGLPADLVRTFRIESIFGFNRTSIGTFIRDQLLGLALGGILGGGLIALVLFLLTRLGDWAWLAAWGAVVAWILLLQAVAPAWLLPLYLKFTPLPEGDLRSAVAAYAARVGFPAAGIFEIDGSRRSSKANAVIAGWGPWRRIALYDTLTAKMSEPEIIAVVAHEVGHWHHRHMRKRLIASVIQMLVSFAVLGVVLKAEIVGRVMGVPGSAAAAMLFFLLVSGPFSELFACFSHATERRHEYEADAFAAKTADGAALATALRKLGVENLSNPTPHPWCVRAWYSHPPMAERLAALRSAASSG